MREVINVSITTDYNAINDQGLSYTIGSDTDAKALQISSIVNFFATAVPLNTAPSENFSIASDCNYYFIFKFSNNYPDSEFYYSHSYNCIVEKIVYITEDSEIIDFKYYKVDDSFDKFMDTYDDIVSDAAPAV